MGGAEVMDLRPQDIAPAVSVGGGGILSREERLWARKSDIRPISTNVKALGGRGVVIDLVKAVLVTPWQPNNAFLLLWIVTDGAVLHKALTMF